MGRLPTIRVDVEANTDQAVAGINRLDDSLDQVRGTAPRATSATRGLSRSFTGLSNVSRQTRSRIQQVGFQVQDIVVQLQSGTSATTTLTQQLPQLAGAFGAVGAIVGAGIALGIPALSAAFSALGSDSVDLEEALENLEDSANSYIEAAKRADLTTGELREEFKNLTPGILAAADALERFAGRDTQNRIDEVGRALSDLFGVAGSGEGRGNIADFFDVNIFLAFTDAQRAAREEARLLTAEFEASQQALADAEGDIDAQAIALTALLRTAEQLAEATGGVSAAENELIGQIANALNETEKHRDATQEVVVRTNLLSEAFEAASIFASALKGTAEGLEQPIRNAANAAADLAAELIVVGTQLAEAERRGGGRGGDPRRFGFSPGDLATLRLTGGAFEADPELPGARGGGGGGAGGAGRGRIENLIEDLQTERETIEQFRTEGLELLMQANEQELAVLGGFNEAKLRLEQEYQERLAGIKGDGLASDVSSVLQGGQQVLSAIGQTNERALRLAKAFGAANALINAYSAYTQVLADPTLPFFAKFAAASSVFAAAIGAVNSIRSVSSSGGGGGGFAGGGGGAGAGGGGPAPLNVRVAGLDPNALFSGASIGGLLERLQDEAGDRGLTLTVAQ